MLNGRGLRHAEVRETAFTHLQSLVDFAEALRQTELAGQHRHKLIPATKSA